ncbi:MAG: hypothetical protein ACJ74Y_15945 [Bryobacteraceae bacterium]
MVIRAILLMILIVSTSLGADKRRVWRIGRLDSVHVASIDPYRSEDFEQTPQLVGPQQPGQNLPYAAAPHMPPRLPNARIRFTIWSDTGSYVAERTTVLTSEPYPSISPSAVDPASIAPWVKELPWIVKFCVEGKSLYYVDAKGKERKARICKPNL